MLIGHGNSDDCTWTKTGEVDVTVSGQLESNDITPDLNITLKEEWLYTLSTICPDASWTQNITIDAEPFSFLMPLVDGHTFTKTTTIRNVQTRISYTLHVPQKQ